MESDLKKTLNKNLAGKGLRNTSVDLSVLKYYKQYAKTYAEIHNGIVVLSDLTANWSFTFMGEIAERLHLSSAKRKLEINSIWEDFLLERVHPEDLAVKHALELQFLDLVKKTEPKERFRYQANSVLRVEGKDGQIMLMSHQIIYLDTPGQEFPQLALCCYTLMPDREDRQSKKNYIFNQVSGEVFPLDKEEMKDVMSVREKEVLRCIRAGMSSKDIAEKLALSVNTVNRHRQNILQKLRVRNSHEAISIYNKMYNQDDTSL
ncbi:response regulator transcription factor [Sphingobacterium detergens]|uniref:response regulator transcription factor n=1 Tax=Sphingobacterium detergens TaxID=1145106 RepID=UPI003AAB03CC